MTLGGKKCSGSLEGGHGGYSGLKGGRGELGFADRTMLVVVVGTVLRPQPWRGQTATTPGFSRGLSAALHLWFLHSILE